MTPEEGRYLALLVHKGFLVEEQARQMMAERQEDEALPEVLARLGFIEPAEAHRLWSNEVGEKPSLTRYELLDRIGAGVTATVWKAQDTEAGVVAIKLLREEQARSPLKRKRFVEEAKILCDLDHQGIVGGHRVAKDQGQYFLVMDYVEGKTLEDILLEDGVLSEDEALSAVFQIAEALRYLRSEGLVHRDIKPGNMMRDDQGRVQLIDLGFATKQGEGKASDTTQGTVQYIAPEQARGEADLDSRADIYALGASLYHLCTGQLPFEGQSSQEILAKQVALELSSAKIRELGLTAQLHYFIEKMMAKEKEIRYQGPEELLEDLEEKCGDRAFMQEALAQEPKSKSTGIPPIVRKRGRRGRPSSKAGRRRRR
jgi:eukaryotic-like serine/threonine-protein kinase